MLCIIQIQVGDLTRQNAELFATFILLYCRLVEIILYTMTKLLISMIFLKKILHNVYFYYIMLTVQIFYPNVIRINNA